MASSQRLRVKDLRRLYQLLGECTELGADPVAWRQHLTQQLSDVIGGQLAIYWEMDVTAKPFDRPFWLSSRIFFDHGWPTPSDRKPFEEHLAGGRPEEGPHVTPDLLQRKFKVFHWSGDMGRNAWLQSQFFNKYVKHTHIDDALFAHQLLRPGGMRWMFVNRALGDQPFSPRDRRLMSVANVELARLLGDKLRPLGEPGVTDLSPRQRDVLVSLMDGDSEKQIARRLGISPNTVHDYVKQLHGRFGVHSRGELLARCRRFWPVLERLCEGMLEPVPNFHQYILASNGKAAR